jgi:predicted ATPase/DNA-binding SARP family transcriptional activator
MQVDVLGPVAVTIDGRPVAGLQTKERALLASLALAAPDAVASSDLETALWGEDSPPTSTASLRAHVSHVRRSLGHEVICRDATGYRLAVDPDNVDAAHLEVLTRRGHRALERGDAHAALADFTEAESLWRGEPLTDLADTPERTAQVERLREVWQQAREGRLAALLEAGREPDALPELHHLCETEPVREQVVGLLMLALYRAGRQVDALRAYRRCRQRLGDEWGIDPSPDLQRLQWQILRQDPQLERQPPSPPVVAPAPISTFVGRSAQVEAVVSDAATHRIVTLHGPAGVGKSRLAMEVARRAHDHFPDGVWWVDLTVTRTGEEVCQAVAGALGVRASPPEPLEKTLAAHLRFRRLLLVPDNCEHVVHPLATLVLTLLQQAPGVNVLATSRTYLSISGEVRREIPPLSTPDVDDDRAAILRSEAVELFQQRRGRLGDEGPDDLDDVAALCRRLDGLPLAIELAAAQSQHSSVHDLAGHLVDGTRAAEPTRAQTAHHATLVRAIDWGYAALPAEEQRLFEWLSVFPGDFDEAAVESVAGQACGGQHRPAAALLADLVDSSLVAADSSTTGMRYRLLYVLREFAAARLAGRDEVAEATDTFAAHYRDVARQAAAPLDGERPGQWLRLVQSEILNLTSALEYLSQSDRPGDALVLARVIGRLQWSESTDMAAELAHVRTAIERAEACEPGTVDPVALARAWNEQITSAYLVGDLTLALHAVSRTQALLQHVDDDAAQAVLHWHLGALHLLATGDLARAEEMLRRGQDLAQRSGATTAQAWCLSHLSQLHSLACTVTNQTAAALAKATELADPADHQLQPHLRLNRTLLHLARHDYDDCLTAGQDCAHYSHRVGNSSIEQAGTAVAGSALVLAGRREEARPILLRAASMARDVNNGMQLGLAVRPLARVADDEGDAVRAALLWGASTAHTPRWPVLDDLFPVRAQQTLGQGFDLQVTLGRAMDPRDVLDTAIG